MGGACIGKHGVSSQSVISKAQYASVQAGVEISDLGMFYDAEEYNLVCWIYCLELTNGIMSNFVKKRSDNCLN